MRRLVLGLPALLLVLGPGPATAADSDPHVYLSTRAGHFPGSVANQGWWSATHSSTDDNTNFLVGRTVDGDVLRNFFTFDLSHQTVPVTRAVLRLHMEYKTSQPAMAYQIYDVSTPPEVLNRNVGTSSAIFDDLGSGTSYGFLQVPDQQVLWIVLNPAGLAALNAARGGYFSLGGRNWNRGYFYGYDPASLQLTLGS